MAIRPDPTPEAKLGASSGASGGGGEAGGEASQQAQPAQQPKAGLQKGSKAIPIDLTREDPYESFSSNWNGRADNRRTNARAKPYLTFPPYLLLCGSDFSESSNSLAARVTW